MYVLDLPDKSVVMGLIIILKQIEVFSALHIIAY